MDRNQENKVYMEVDVVGLVNILAEEAWEETTKMKPRDHLYEVVVVDEAGNSKMQVVAHWAREFFAMRKCYLNLINSFAKNPVTEVELDEL